MFSFLLKIFPQQVEKTPQMAFRFRRCDHRIAEHQPCRPQHIRRCMKLLRQPLLLPEHPQHADQMSACRCPVEQDMVGIHLPFLCPGADQLHHFSQLQKRGWKSGRSHRVPQHTGVITLIQEMHRQRLALPVTELLVPSARADHHHGPLLDPDLLRGRIQKIGLKLCIFQRTFHLYRYLKISHSSPPCHRMLLYNNFPILKTSDSCLFP